MSAIALTALFALPGSVSAQAASDPAVTYQEDPAHDGHQANDTLAPPLAQRWSATFSGHVSYALIANGEVFVMVGHQNVYANFSGYTFGVSVHAFAQSTGSELWSFDMPATGVYADDFGAAAYDNGQVFAVNADGTMAAFDAATGHLNWKQTGLGTGIPVAVNGVVYEGSRFGISEGADAVSEADGHVIWSRNDLSTHGQNPTVTAGGLYLTDWCQNNYDLAPSDGHVVWTTTPTGCTTGGDEVSPVSSGRLYSRSPGGGNQIYDATTGAPLGSYPSDVPEAFDGNVAFLSNGTQLSAVDLSTGTVLWRFNGDCDLLSSPVVANGYVYIGSTQGHIYALSEQNGMPVWSDSIGSPIGPHQDWSPDGPPFGLTVGEGLLAVAALDKLVLYAPGSPSSPAPAIQDSLAVSHYGTTGQVFWITRGPDGNLWATEFYDNKIARITTGGAVSEFNIPTASSNPVHIVSGPDGALWFTELGGKVGRITTSGSFTEYPLSTNNAGWPQPYGITVGPDNNLWITEAAAGQIVQMHTDGSVGATVTMPGATPSDGKSPHGITTGPDGNLWVTEAAPGRAAVVRITPAGLASEFPLPTTIETEFAQPEDIVSGPDGNLWFTIPGDVGYPSSHTAVRHAELGRVTPAGSITYFVTPTPFSSPYGLTVGPDGALWFTEAEHGDHTPAKIGRMTTAGEAKELWDTGGDQRPRGIANGPDGNLWFGDALPGVGRVVPSLGPCPVASQATPTPTLTFQSLGGAVKSSAAAASWGPNRLDVFARGTDDTLEHKWWDGVGWHGWESLGGAITSAPAAVSWAGNRLDVFVRGTDNGMWHKWWDGSSWSGWEPQGGGLGQGPAVSSWAANRLDVFVEGTANALYHKWWDGSSWSGWEWQGGALTAAPAAVSWGPNRIDVLARASDNGMLHKWWNGSTWSGWEPQGGVLASGPSVASISANHLETYAIGTDGAVYEHDWTGAGWSGWNRIGGSWAAAAPAAVSQPGSGHVDVFPLGTDNTIWHAAL